MEKWFDLNTEISKFELFDNMGDELDDELEGIVRLLNNIRGIRTYASCAGHPGSDNKETGYIGMKVDNVELMEELIDKIRGTTIHRNFIFELDINVNFGLVLSIRWMTLNDEDKEEQLNRLEDGILKIILQEEDKMELNDKCSKCGKTLEEANTKVPQTQLGVVSGAWLCEECFNKE